MRIRSEKENEKQPRKKRRWLRMTIGIKISFILTLMVAVLGFFSIMFVRGFFVMILMEEEIQHLYSVGLTSLGVIGTVNSKKACDRIKSVYSSIPYEEKEDPADSAYLANYPDFDTMHDDIDEVLIDEVLSVIKDKNTGIQNVGLCLLDDDKKRIVWVRSTESDYPCGFWSDFIYTKSATMDGEEPLYVFDQGIREGKLRIAHVRVLIPINKENTGNLDGYMYIDKDNDKLYDWLFIFTLFYCIVYLFVVVLAWIFTTHNLRRTVVRPLRKLSKAANQWADSPDKLADVYYFDKLKIKTNDELGDLCEAMQGMETELHGYMTHLEEVTREKQRVSTELEFAARLQANMLPDKLEFTGQPFAISAFMKPARSVGGDFYDFFMIGEDRIAMIIADVSDKGVPASLFMVVSKTLMGNRIKDNPDDIAAAVSRANVQLFETNKELMFVTVFVCVYSMKEGTLSYVNAGHEDPIIYRKSEDKFSYIIEDHDLFMGVDPDIQFTERKIPFAPGDKLFLYTDGVTEAMNTRDVVFGGERLLTELNKNTALCGDEVIDSVWNEISEFQKNKSQSDDVTMLLFEA